MTIYKLYHSGLFQLQIKKIGLNWLKQKNDLLTHIY